MLKSKLNSNINPGFKNKYTWGRKIIWPTRARTVRMNCNEPNTKYNTQGRNAVNKKQTNKMYKTKTSSTFGFKNLHQSEQ